MWPVAGWSIDTEICYCPCALVFVFVTFCNRHCRYAVTKVYLSMKITCYVSRTKVRAGKRCLIVSHPLWGEVASNFSPSSQNFYLFTVVRLALSAPPNYRPSDWWDCGELIWSENREKTIFKDDSMGSVWSSHFRKLRLSNFICRFFFGSSAIVNFNRSKKPWSLIRMHGHRMFASLVHIVIELLYPSGIARLSKFPCSFFSEYLNSRCNCNFQCSIRFYW